jgi:hypothetical protein
LRRELRQQVAGSRVRTIEDLGDNYGSIEFAVSEGAAREHALIAEGWADDEDGVPINLLLFVSEHELRTLEIVKLDGSPIKSMPAATRFRVWVYGEVDTACPPWPDSSLRSE